MPVVCVLYHVFYRLSRLLAMPLVRVKMQCGRRR